MRRPPPFRDIRDRRRGASRPAGAVRVCRRRRSRGRPSRSASAVRIISARRRPIPSTPARRPSCAAVSSASRFSTCSVVEDAPRELRADAGNGEKELLRLERAAQPLQLRPASGGQHLRQRRRDRAADPGKRGQAVAALLREDGVERPIEALDHARRALVGRDAKTLGALLAQEIGIFAKISREQRRWAGDRRVAAPWSEPPAASSACVATIYRGRRGRALRGVKSPLGPRPLPGRARTASDQCGWAYSGGKEAVFCKLAIPPQAGGRLRRRGE